MAGSTQHATELTEPVGGDDHVQGAADAAVTVVEYVDFQCPDCRRAAPAVAMLLKRFSRDVRFAMRHFPVEDLHPQALQAAEAAEAAAAQGRFWEMAALLLDNSRRLDAAGLEELAGRAGLDSGRYVADMASHVHLARIRSDREGGIHSGVRGTPTFFVDGVIHDVTFGLRSLFEAVAARLRPTGGSP